MTSLNLAEVTPKPPIWAEIAKHAALLLGATYAVGLIVVSVFYGSFGIPVQDFVKPKVFAAGVLFLVFAAVPLVAMARRLGLFGLRTTGGSFSVPISNGYLDLVRCCDFFYVAVLLRIAAATLFEPFEMLPGRERDSYWFGGSIAFYVACNLAAQRWGQKGARIVVPLAVVPAVVQVLVIAKFFSHEFLGQTAWFFLCGALFVILKRAFAGSARLTFDWERQALGAPFLLVLFSLYVYGHVRAQFLGGTPVPVQLRLIRATSFSTEGIVDGYLLDDTSAGYYILRSVSARQAYLIPRDAVGDIRFGPPDKKP